MSQRFLKTLKWTPMFIAPALGVISCANNHGETVYEHSLTKHDVDQYNHEIQKWEAQFPFVKGKYDQNWIEPSAFANVNLSLYPDFYIPEVITSIGDNAFAYATLPINFTLPEHLLSIGEGAFKAVHLPERFTLPETVFSIESYAFANAYLPENFTVSANVIYLGYNTFNHAHIQRGFNFNTSFSYLPTGTFQGAVFQESLSIPEAIHYLEASAFENAQFLDQYDENLNDAQINFSHNAFSLGSKAFANLIFNYDFQIPESVVSMGESVFARSTFKRDFSFNANSPINLLPSAFFQNASFQGQVSLSNNIKAISELTFDGADFAHGLDLSHNHNLVYIGRQAFHDVNFNQTTCPLILPSSIESYGNFAFENTQLYNGFKIPDLPQLWRDDLPKYQDEINALKSSVIDAFRMATIPINSQWEDQQGNALALPEPGALVAQI